MKITLVVILFSAFAYAQTQPATPPQAIESTKVSGLRVGAYYSMADTIDESGAAGSLTFSNKDKGSGSLGLVVENNVPLQSSGSMTFGFSYDLSRTISTYSGNLGSTPLVGTYSSKPTVTIGNLYANYGAKTSPSTEFYGGLGYSMITLGNSSFTSKSAIGYQFGMNHEFNKDRFVMVEYRIINGTGETTLSGTKVTIDTASITGITVGMKFGI